MSTVKSVIHIPDVEDASVAELRARVEGPLRHVGRRSNIVMSVLALVALLAVGAWVRQVRVGLGVTGLNDRIVWGLYIATFVFFIGISMAGTLISAILRLVGAEWRRPITRIAECITVASLLIAVTMIAADMGRPDRLLSVLWRANLRSPIVWDVLAITTYLVGSLIYFVLPLIPDAALLRDTAGYGRARRMLYRVVAAGWTGREDQHHRLQRAISVTALTVIPAAIAVHSVTAWLFGMTLREGWSSPLIAPYFVASALFSGTAVIVLVLGLVRRVYGLGSFITADHFANLGRLLMIFGIAYGYLTFAEYLTGGYKLREGEDELLHHLMQGPFAPMFWTSILVGTVAPIALLASRGRRRTRTILVASSLAALGMMLKRFLIVVPSLGLPVMPVAWGRYRPSATEIIIVAGAFAGFALIVMVLARTFQIVSVTEVAEGLTGDRPASPARRSDDERPSGHDRVRRRRVVTVGAALVIVIIGSGLLPAFGANEGTAAPPGRIDIDVVLKDAMGRTLPGAKVDLVLDLTFFREKRLAVIDEARTDAGGRATLTYRPAESGVFKGRVRFPGAAMWSASDAPIVLRVGRPMWRWVGTKPGPVPWARAWFVLIPVGIVWAFLLWAVIQAFTLRRLRGEPR